MGSGLNVGELAAFLDLDVNPFEKHLNQAEAKGVASAKRIGDKMTKAVTLPLAGVAVAGGKMAADYETAFARMVGLAGVPAKEVDNLKESVLALAGRTAVAPAELADALYFAASAGLDSAAAMNAVDVAAQGAAAGLGNTQDIVGLVASAVASYGAENITAAKAVDILTAAVRAGRADPAELAGSMGALLPIASKLGISFDQVGGTVAYLSNVFGDTDKTITAVQGVLVKLLSPSAQGKKALQQMGTSAEELQAAIDKRGLLGALDLLRSKGFAQNQDALRGLFDDIEGFQGAVALIDDKSGRLADTLDQVAGSAGATAEALGEVMGTDSQTAKQAITDLQVGMIRLGQQLLPVAAKAAQVGSTIVKWFGDLPEPVQQAVIALGGILAVSGPLISVAARVKDVWSTVSRVLRGVGPDGEQAAGGLSAVLRTAGRATIALGVLATAGKVLDDTFGKDFTGGEEGINKLENALARLAAGQALDSLKVDLDDVADGLDYLAHNDNFGTKLLNDVIHLGGLLGSDWANPLGDAKEKVDKLDKALASLAQRDSATAATALALAAERMGVNVDDLLPRLNDYRDVLTQLDTDQVVGAGSADGLASGISAAGDAASGASSKLVMLAKSIESTFGAQIDYDRAVIATDKALSDLSGGGGGASRAGRSMRDTAREARDAAKAIEDAKDGVVKANEALIESQQALADAQKPAEPQDLEQGGIDIEHAKIEAARAKLRVQEAQDALNKAADSDDPTAAANAALDLKDARLAVRESTFRVADAEKALAELKKKGTSQDKAVIDAQKRVQDQIEAVADAQERVIDAQERAADVADRAADAADGVSGSYQTLAERILTAKDLIKDTAERWVLLNGETLDSVEGQRLYIEKLQELANKLAPGSPLRTDLQSFIDDLNQNYTINIDADMSEAERKFRHFVSTLNLLVPLGPILEPESTPAPAPEPAPKPKQRTQGLQRASGGQLWPGRWLVGEEGPELVDVGGHGYVYNAAETKSLLAPPRMPAAAPVAFAGGGDTYIHVPIQFVGNAGSSTDREALRREVLGVIQDARRISGSPRPNRYRI